MTADLTAGIITADLIDVAALNGKTITGSTVQTAASGARVVLDTAMRLYNTAGDLLAEAVPNAAPLGYPDDAGFIVYNTVGFGRYWAQLSRGFVRFGKDGSSYLWPPMIKHYLAGSNSVMELDSGVITNATGVEAQVQVSLVSSTDVTAGNHPYVSIGGSAIETSGRADLRVGGAIGTTDAVRFTGETWHNPAYTATWTGTTTLNNNPTFRSMQYRKDAEGNVWILGACRSTGTNASVFTLPSGYYSASRHLLPAYLFGSAVVSGWAQVTEAGVVAVNASLSGTAIASGTQLWINGKFPLDE